VVSSALCLSNFVICLWYFEDPELIFGSGRVGMRWDDFVKFGYSQSSSLSAEVLSILSLMLYAVSYCAKFLYQCSLNEFKLSGH
jgi:hypothetical protein